MGTTPNTKRQTLPNGVFCIRCNKYNRKAIVHVESGSVQRIELWKVNAFGNWGKMQCDQIRAS